MVLIEKQNYPIKQNTGSQTFFFIRYFIKQHQLQEYRVKRIGFEFFLCYSLQLSKIVCERNQVKFLFNSSGHGQLGMWPKVQSLLVALFYLQWKRDNNTSLRWKKKLMAFKCLFRCELVAFIQSKMFVTQNICLGVNRPSEMEIRAVLHSVCLLFFKRHLLSESEIAFPFSPSAVYFAFGLNSLNN